ncbi:hypothetical protein [Curtobacterium sp. MCBA15_008]|uniref:hypothetical protein n=1 Tax=Curtobacterium sp. MCBA15_008 TaxID=1898736 RepID=UPI0008DDB7CC|nr:hypothetical protein [Curtobacterium sp. MCBA15_008]OII14441.1 hypothetical protein BIU96_10955 [Curtobacterium sp. MCBA15_008]
MTASRLLGSALCVCILAVGTAGCGIQVHTSSSEAKEIAEENGARILQALSDVARGARSATELQEAIRTVDTGAFEEVESWASGEFDEKRGDLRTAVYKTSVHKTRVEALSYASGTAQGGGLSNAASVYGCFSATLSPGSWETPTESAPCPEFTTTGSVTEISLTPPQPTKPLPDLQSTPGG